MSDASTKTMIAHFEERRSAPTMLQDTFTVPEGGYHNTEEVEFDVIRHGEHIAVPVRDLSQTRTNEISEFTNRKVKPPILSEEAPIKASDLFTRNPGQNPFTDVSFMSKLVQRTNSLYDQMLLKIVRTLELQASQIYRTGMLDLTDETGATVYSIDFQMRASHKITAGDAWNDNTDGDPLLDLNTACDVIRINSGLDADQVWMSDKAFDAARANPNFISSFETRRADFGSLVPMVNPGTNHGNYRGSVDVGTHRLDLYTYAARYQNPQTGVSTKYLPDESVVVRSSRSRMDKLFGAIPTLVPIDPRLADFIPANTRTNGLDIYPRAWVDQRGNSMGIMLSSRPLLVPTQIDSFAHIDTGL